MAWADVADRICIAQIGGAHGLRGEVRLKSFTADPLAVKDYGPLETEDGSATFVIETVRPVKSHFVARLRGIPDRTAAERLAQIKLYVPRDRLPAPAADEFYHADLIGLCAVTADGNEIGTVVAVHDFGAGDVIELRPKTGGTTIMLAFTDAFVPRVDIAHGRIIVVSPADAPTSGSNG